MTSATTHQAEFRRRLGEARDRTLYAISHARDEIVTHEPHQPGSVWEEAATQSATDTLSRIEGRERHELDEIAAARAPLESGAYGVCERCGRAIALTRLRALPIARRCTPCESNR